MKKFLVGTLLILLTVNVDAQWYERKYGVQGIGYLSETQLAQALQQAENNTQLGKIITVAGIGCELIGVAIIASNFCIMGCSSQEIAAANAGGILFAAGFVTMVVGIPIWAVNGGRKKDIELALVRLNDFSYLGNNQSTCFGFKKHSTLGLSVKINF